MTFSFITTRVSEEQNSICDFVIKLGSSLMSHIFARQVWYVEQWHCYDLANKKGVNFCVQILARNTVRLSPKSPHTCVAKGIKFMIYKDLALAVC